MTEMKKRAKEHFLEPETRDGYYIDVKRKEAWKEMLTMLEILMRICEKHGLRFFMVGGSMLGAARHSGFIPWDDDIDVGMPRKDYNKLKKVLADELPEHLIVQLVGQGNDDSYWPFIKIRNCNTAGIFTYHTNLHMRHNMGLFLDVIPIDGVPQRRVARRIFNRITIEFSYLRRWPTIDIGNKPVNRVRKFFYRLLGRNFLFSLYEKYLTLCSKVCTEKAAEAIAYVGVKDILIWDVAWFDDVVWHDFEYLKVPLPKEFEKSLSRHYGLNWKTPVKGTARHEQLDMSTTKGWKQVLVEKYGYTYAELENLK